MPIILPSTFPLTFGALTAEVAVSSLRARTWCKGNRIDLSWAAPAGVSVIEYKLKRSRYTFSLFVDDAVEVIYTGTDTSYSDTGLDDNTVYYYTIYWTADGVDYFTDDSCRVAGLSIEDFEAEDGDHYLYERIAKGVRRLDALQPPPDDYSLRRFMDIIQCGVNLIRGQINVLQHLNDWNKVPAGRTGEPDHQYEIIKAINKQLGFPPLVALGIDTMRRTALQLTFVRKRKGSCVGLVQFVKMITTWDVNCFDVDEGECGGGLIMRTWDGLSSSTTRQSKRATDGGDIDISTAGVLVDAGATFTAELYETGVVVDAFGNVVCISTNTETEVTYEDTTAQIVAEEVHTLAVVEGTQYAFAANVVSGNTSIYLGGHPDELPDDGPYVVRVWDAGNPTGELVTVTSLNPAGYLLLTAGVVGSYGAGSGRVAIQHMTLARVAGEKPFNDSAYVGYELKDSAGDVFTIEGSEASSDGLSIAFKLAGTPVAGTVAIAKAYADEPRAYADRRPEVFYTIYHGEHYLTWNPMLDLRLIGTPTDPFDRLWGGGARVAGVPYSPGDVIVWVPEGVASVVSKSTGVTAEELTDTTQAWAIDEHRNRYLCPNRNQTKLYKILSNTATTLTVEPGVDITDIAGAGDHYFVLTPLEALRYQGLEQVVHTILPHATRAFVWFE